VGARHGRFVGNRQGIRAANRSVGDQRGAGGLVPASVARKMEADMIGKALASRLAPAIARAEA
jgi:hypothetical protein